MKANKLKVAVSPPTNRIFVGKILKEGVWDSRKQDITMDCLDAVAEHVKNFGRPVEVINADNGKLIYRIIVEYK